jgi:hypothetical protein
MITRTIYASDPKLPTGPPLTAAKTILDPTHITRHDTDQT